jgi:hypothetical protein
VKPCSQILPVLSCRCRTSTVGCTPLLCHRGRRGLIDHAELSPVPNWMGSDRERSVEQFEDRLTLSASPMLLAGSATGPLPCAEGCHGRQKTVERSQRTHPQGAHPRGSCRRHPQGCGTHRHQASASKPDPRPEVAVGYGGGSCQLRRGRANLILLLRAAASIPASLIRATAGEHQMEDPSGGIRTPNRQIRRLVISVDLVGSRRICLLR